MKKRGLWRRKGTSRNTHTGVSSSRRCQSSQMKFKQSRWVFKGSQWKKTKEQQGPSQEKSNSFHLKTLILNESEPTLRILSRGLQPLDLITRRSWRQRHITGRKSKWLTRPHRVSLSGGLKTKLNFWHLVSMIQPKGRRVMLFLWGQRMWKKNRIKRINLSIWRRECRN